MLLPLLSEAVSHMSVALQLIHPMRICVTGVWLHGEAVAAGTVMAADLSLRLGWIDQSLYDRARNLMAAANLPTVPPEVGTW